MNIDYSTRESVTVRPPATALLCIDSADRDTTRYPNPYNFQINKKQTLIPGAFTRIGVTEVVMGWYTYNVNSGFNQLQVDISGDPGSPRTMILAENMYTAYQALETLVSDLNDLSGTTGAHFVLGTRAVPGPFPPSTFSAGVEWVIVAETVGGAPLDWQILPIAGNNLYTNLNVFNLGYQPIQGGGMPDLRYTRYVDIVSTDLTLSQNVKDTSTLTDNRNLLCRYYFASENPSYDAGGLIQYIGYTPFYVHRQWNVPKQIRFEPINSVGSLAFQVYDDQGNLIPAPDGSTINWNMTLQLSEN